MATYIVTRVRKELSADGSHRHIAGVCTESGGYYPRQHVVDSIKAGDKWRTRADGYEAVITTVAYCFRATCAASPYIKTDPDSTKKDNLENLEEC
jgi:hypothetical protein